MEKSVDALKQMVELNVEILCTGHGVIESNTASEFLKKVYEIVVEKTIYD